MGNMLNFAKIELKAAGITGSKMDDEMAKCVLQLIKVFSKQGHSGMSAPMCIDLFHKLARYQPLVPLSGNEDEWVEISSGIFQNKRCSSVFKENGKAYNIDGKVFEDEHGSWYTNKDSRVFIKFPYMPKTRYIKYKARKK